MNQARIRISAAILLAFVACSTTQAAITDNLSGWWACSEGSSGSNFTDSHGSNTLTQVNSPGVTTGKIGGARTFVRASSQYATIASNSGLVISSSATIVVGFKLTTLPGSGERYQLVSKDSDSSGDTRDYALEVYESGGTRKVHVVVFGTELVILDASNFGGLSADTWYLVRAWRNAATNTFGIQVNSAAPNTTTVAMTPVNSSAPFTLGKRPRADYPDPLNGTIDQVGFWQRVLTDDEWARLYNGGNWRAYPFTPASSRYYYQQHSSARKKPLSVLSPEFCANPRVEETSYQPAL